MLALFVPTRLRVYVPAASDALDSVHSSNGSPSAFVNVNGRPSR